MILPEDKEDNDLPELLPVPVRALHSTAIDLARRLNTVITQLVESKGFAELRIDVSQGLLRMLRVKRSFKVASANEAMRRLKELFDFLEHEEGFAELHIEVVRGVPRLVWCERSFKLGE